MSCDMRRGQRKALSLRDGDAGSRMDSQKMYVNARMLQPCHCSTCDTKSMVAEGALARPLALLCS